jgi:ATP-dependent Lon protease
MRDFRDAKAMAQTLREALKPKSVSLTHSESLELVAKILGFHDWNVLSARIQSEHQPPAAKPGTAIAATALLPIPAGARLPTVPLRDIVLFPTMIVPLFMGREASKRAVEHAMAGDKRILAVAQRRAADDNPAPDALYGVGVTANVIDLSTLDDGTIRLVVKGLERAAAVLRLADGQFLEAEIAPIEESRGQEAEAFSLMRAVLEKFQAYRNAPDLSSPPYSRLPHIREPGVLADAVASWLTVEIDRRQDLLETSDVITRLEKILALMKTDLRAA